MGPLRPILAVAGLVVMLTEGVGKVRMEGTDYVMQDGVVVELRFNA